ncbi:MAG: transglutaminase-like cysteine peptidase [Rhizobiaceae bacterium]
MFLGGVPLSGVAGLASPAQRSPVALIEPRIWSPFVDDMLPDATIRTGAISRKDAGLRSAQPAGEFGSVKFRIAAFPAARRWERVRASLSGCEGFGCPKAETTLSALAAEVKPMRFVARLDHVNRRLNAAITYTPDSRNYRQRDYWATIGEIIGRGRGDCEDYAIIKMAALIRAGVPERSMSVVVLYDHGNRAFHAVLSVATTSGNYILDNMRDEAYRDVSRPDYQPLYSLSADRAWIHGIRKPSLVAARALNDLVAIAPGEGVRAD